MENTIPPGEYPEGIDTHFLRYPPGHYYSPLPSRAEYDRVAPRVYAQENPLPGIDIRQKEQFRLFARLVRWYADMPFKRSLSPPLRYYFDNPAYSYADAFYLYAMMREFKPARIVEVGSGFSSCVMLDTNELFLNNNTCFQFIEPYPERLLSLLHPEEIPRTFIHACCVQDVDLSVFTQLQPGDFLFIDSSHVAKVGSDVLHLLNTVLPCLNKGVIIHFHDIFYPFQYPPDWLDNGIAWNECYFLHAFLQYNAFFSIVLFGHYLGLKFPQMLSKSAPLCLRNTGGSLWLEKVQ